MNPAKFAELQVQMKQNQQELGDYLKELDDWTKEIKQKEQEVVYGQTSQPKNDQPVRSAPKKSSSNGRATKSAKSPAQKLHSYDYRAWDKFDVDAALKSSDEEEENVPKPLPKSEKEALAFKEKGNELFGQKKYDEALDCYSAALKLQPKNPTFLSNRAICYLKLERFEDAEADCSLALQVEPKNTKVLFRRGTARVGLSKLSEAKADFEAVLKLEPGNKLAKQEVDRLVEQTRLSKAVERIVEQEAVSKIPDWFPIPAESAPDFGIMPVKAWSGNYEGEKMTPLPIRESANLNHLWRSTSPSLNHHHKTDEARAQAPRFVYAPPPDSWLPVPDAPSSAFQFQSDLRRLRSNREQLHAYLQKVDANSLPELFGLSLESSMLSDIIECYRDRESFDEKTALIFANLQKVNRYSTVALFLDGDVKLLLDRLVKHAQSISV